MGRPWSPVRVVGRATNPAFRALVHAVAARSAAVVLEVFGVDAEGPLKTYRDGSFIQMRSPASAFLPPFPRGEGLRTLRFDLHGQFSHTLAPGGPAGEPWKRLGRLFQAPTGGPAPGRTAALRAGCVLGRVHRVKRNKQRRRPVGEG